LAQCRISDVAIRGVVCVVPGAPHDIEEFGDAFDPHEVEKIKKTVGLSSVHRVRAGQTTGDLAIEAANILIADMAWERDSIDGIILVTQTPDYTCPATACVVHGKLGLKTGAFAFDVNQGCSGYVYGLWLAVQTVSSGAAKRMILLGGDTPSRFISPLDKSVAMLFGDAGTATALEFEPLAPPLSFVLGSDGTGYENLFIPAGGFRSRPSVQSFERAVGIDGNLRSPMDLYMEGLAIFNFTLQRVPTLVKETLQFHGWEIPDVDGFLFHQANGFILKTLANKLPLDRVPTNISKYGNSSVSSIPLLLADDWSKRVQSEQPQNLLLSGFGIGYSWAAAAITISNLKTAKVVQAQEP
jgi:3-oxoacyl-[acyl-carrier-protein] synthase-3